MLKERSGKKRAPASECAREQTLDARHCQVVDALSLKRADLVARREERDRRAEERDVWVARIAGLQASPADAPAYDDAWSCNLQLRDAVDALDADICAMESCEEEIDYYVGTGAILFEYYDLLERQNVSAQATAALPTVAPPPAARGRKRTGPAPPARSILDALQIRGGSGEDAGAAEPSCAAPPAGPQVTSDRAFRDKQGLVEDYMAAVDPTYLRAPPVANGAADCERCRVPLTCLLQEGIMVCAECGYQELMLVEQNKPIHRLPSKETSHYSYKRLSHFTEHVMCLQGKESTLISDEVFEGILAEIRKERIDPHKITYNKMREILKKTHNNKYYEHVYYIIYRINGIPAPSFSQELEEKLRSMFKDIQAPFLKHCPASRKNFLSYSYCLYKLFEILEKDEYLKYFHLLKSREKLHQQDQVWRKICEELGWQFIESI
jgi:hypothetical protein